MFKFFDTRVIFIAFHLFTFSLSTYQENFDVQFIKTLSGEQLCVAAGNDLQSAITWDYWKNNETLNKSVFEPNLEHLGLNCNFDLSENCSEKYTNDMWSLQTSREIILDRRWENLKVIETDIPFVFKEYTIKNGMDFEFAISIRAEKSAHLYFCDGDTGNGSGNCYRFIIGGWNNSRTIIRKCTINTDNEEFKKPICENVARVDTKVLSEDEWKHIVIKNENFKFTVNVIGQESTLLNYYDSEFPKYEIKKVLVGINCKGEYKVHESNYIYARINERKKFGDLQKYDKEKKFCVAIYTKMCSMCTMTVELVANVNNKEEGITKEIFITKGEQWREVSLSTVLDERYKGKRKYLYIQTNSLSSQKFWKISDVRSCSDNDFRVLNYQGSQNPTCIVMKGIYPKFYNSYSLNAIDTLHNSTKNIYVLPKITDFNTFNKSTNFVSLRWKQEVSNDSFNIICMNNNHEPCNSFTNIEKCKLWPEFYCKSFYNLERDTDYTFSIKPKNKGIHGYILPSISITINTFAEVPSPPQDPEAYFDNNDNLIVSCKLPDRINGQLKYFQVDILHLKNGMYRPYTEDRFYVHDFNILTFNHTILPPEDGWVYSSKHMLEFTAVNERGKSDVVNITVDTPPITPSFGGKLILSDTTSNSTVITIPSARDANQDSYLVIFVYTSAKEKNLAQIQLEQNETEGVDEVLYEEMKEKCDLNDLAYFAYVSYESQLFESNIQKSIVIGDGDVMHSNLLNKQIVNEELIPSTEYHLCVLLMNRFKEFKRFHVDWTSFKTNAAAPPKESRVLEKLGGMNHIYWLIFGFCVVGMSVVCIIFMVCRKMKDSRRNTPLFYKQILRNESNGAVPNFTLREEDGYLQPVPPYASNNMYLQTDEDHLYEEIKDPKDSVHTKYDNLLHESPDFIMKQKVEVSEERYTKVPRRVDNHELLS